MKKTFRLKPISLEPSQANPATKTQTTGQELDGTKSHLALLPHGAIDEIFEWLAYFIVEQDSLPGRALAACAYDSLGALLALTWQSEMLAANLRETMNTADGAVDLPAIRSVVTLPR